ncbi:MAG: hypothetical protein HYS71_00750 [Candidatus Omnitrophica bacterium]|nr:hypothetical protein [Candidatus Omnitrophota bacterium]
MATDPICGMTGVIERHGQWFCSERCIVEFERRAASRTPRPEAAVSCHATGTRWYLDPWVWVPLSGLLLSMAGQ